MRHLALFNGIGGFQLAAHWAGWQNIAHVEIDSWCNSKVELLFPESRGFENIKDFNGKPFRKKIDIITGGDPCQPHSFAGLGKGQEDERYLWPDMLRIIREVRCPFVINENVAGSISNGIVDLKINDLENEGYTCRAYVIPAEAVGAIHQRERVWVVGYHPKFKKENQWTASLSRASPFTKHKFDEPVKLWDCASNTDCIRFEEFYFPTVTTAKKDLSRFFGSNTHAHGNISRDTLESAVFRMLNGLPKGMDYTERSKRLKALGNAIVPQIAYEIMKGLEKINHPIE